MCGRGSVSYTHLSGDPDWKNFSVGEVLGTGFFELFETLLSYLTNTLSFMRVGAYAITHVGLMLVVHMLDVYKRQ